MIAADVGQDTALADGFHAFRDDLHAQEMTDLDNRPQKLGLLFGPFHRLDKGTVDLQPVGLQPQQAQDRGMTCPEVVNLDPDLLRADPVLTWQRSNNPGSVRQSLQRRVECRPQGRPA